jgi:hypothetical protein
MSFSSYILLPNRFRRLKLNVVYCLPLLQEPALLLTESLVVDVEMSLCFNTNETVSKNIIYILVVHIIIIIKLNP